MKFDRFTSPLGQPYVSEIEEVPLYHYLLGDSVLVLQVPGCPLRCSYCDRPLLARSQDWSPYDPDRIAEAMEQLGSEPGFAGVVWGGGEPSLHWDNVVECSRKVHEAGKKVVVATNGGLTADLLRDSPGTVDALLVRFKGFASEHGFTIRHGPDMPFLENLVESARRQHVSFVYLSNCHGHFFNNTMCPNCYSVVVDRTTRPLELPFVTDGKCRYCGTDLGVILDKEIP